eukprot:6183418-Pleurochrysis_carterae.AAC.1
MRIPLTRSTIAIVSVPAILFVTAHSVLSDRYRARARSRALLHSARDVVASRCAPHRDTLQPSPRGRKRAEGHWH